MLFRITCGGNLLPFVNTSNITVTQVIFPFAMSCHVAERQQASPVILLAIYRTVKFFYEDTTHSLHHMHTPLTLALK